MNEKNVTASVLFSSIDM